MKTVSQILTRLAAYAGASAVGAAAPLLIAGNSQWWLAALGAVVPHVALILGELFRAYGRDGKLTQDEIDSAFSEADK